MYGLIFCFAYEVLKLYVHLILIIMLGLFIVVSKVEQRLLPNTAGKRSYMAPILVIFPFPVISLVWTSVILVFERAEQISDLMALPFLHSLFTKLVRGWIAAIVDLGAEFEVDSTSISPQSHCSPTLRLMSWDLPYCLIVPFDFGCIK